MMNSLLVSSNDIECILKLLSRKFFVKVTINLKEESPKLGNRFSQHDKFRYFSTYKKSQYSRTVKI